MTHRGPFQPLLFCDSVRLSGRHGRLRSGGGRPFGLEDARGDTESARPSARELCPEPRSRPSVCLVLPLCGRHRISKAWRSSHRAG